MTMVKGCSKVTDSEAVKYAIFAVPMNSVILYINICFNYPDIDTVSIGDGLQEHLHTKRKACSKLMLTTFLFM